MMLLFRLYDLVPLVKCWGNYYVKIANISISFFRYKRSQRFSPPGPYPPRKAFISSLLFSFTSWTSSCVPSFTVFLFYSVPPARFEKSLVVHPLGRRPQHFRGALNYFCHHPVGWNNWCRRYRLQRPSENLVPQWSSTHRNVVHRVYCLCSHLQRFTSFRYFHPFQCI